MPRAIIVICGQILDAGLEKGVPIVNEDFSQKTLGERGIL